MAAWTSDELDTIGDVFCVINATRRLDSRTVGRL
jgi:hypothetical protein